MKKDNKILILGDLHFREDLSYADYIDDRRAGEKKNILDFMVKSAKDCDHVVFLGDCFDTKNPSAKTIKEFTSFVESFGKKEIYIISGNHEKKGDGTTALDYLKEITDKPNWHLFTTLSNYKIGEKKVSFLPYMLPMELGVETYEEATDKIVETLEKGDILFAHHAISGTTFNGIKTESLKEVVLPKDKIEKKFNFIAAGHIHGGQSYGKVTITGNVFTTEVGDLEKFIYKLDEDIIEKLKVPGRAIVKLENPTIAQITKLKKDSIVKIIVTDKTIDIEALKVVASELDAYMFVEDYPNERKKVDLDTNNAFDFSVEAVLRLYAEAKGVDIHKLLKGLSLLNG